MKTAIVTGGTSGIGLGLATMLVKRGYHVITTYSKTVNKNFPDDIESFKIDQSNRKETYKFLDYIKIHCKTIDCIICNAGITIRKSFTDTSDDDWDKMMEIQVNSHYIIIRELYGFIPNGSRIIFTGSQMGINPHAMVLAYGVMKAAVHAMVRNLVKEFEGTGTTINAVVPGFVDTPWKKNKPENIKRNIFNKTAIHRFGSVEEIVKGFEFCIDNPFVNGSLVEINGGYSYK